MMMKSVVGVLGVVTMGILGSCHAPSGPTSNAVAERKLILNPDGGSLTNLVALNQGWTSKDANWFYDITQGSWILPYDWFLHLEQADNEALFRNPAHMASFRFLPRMRGPGNPDGLPVGFAKDAPDRHRAFVGLTCAACHTAQLNYRHTGYLIDGGPALADLEGFLESMASAMEATRDNQDKFDRFADRVLGPNSSKESEETLLAELNDRIAKRQGYNHRNFPGHGEEPVGFARIDAFGAILNEVSYTFLDQDPANLRPADAPVSIPFLWDTPQHDAVQWNGVATNGGLGDLGRNVGEVLGVFGELEIPEDEQPLLGYRSSVRVRNLLKIEKHVGSLVSPMWPEALPAPDPTLVAQGKPLYITYCNECHVHFDDNGGLAFDRLDPKRKILADMRDVGTDERMDRNFQERFVKTGRLEGKKKAFLLSKKTNVFAATESGGDILGHAVTGAILGFWKKAPKDDLADIRFARDDMKKSLVPEYKYKGRPLNGIWATAPYLHNGSVPNLYQLLLPGSNRVDRFWVGSREFDPAHVGYQYDSGLSEFDASVPGNLNEGHEYGTGVSEEMGGDGKPGLTPDQRMAILEFMKTL